MTVIPGADALSDAELAGAVSDVLSTDRTTDNSFTLHAALELLARVDLLPLVDDALRPAARARLVSLADQFAASGDPVPEPGGPDHGSAAAAEAALLAAIGDGDADAADHAWAWLVDHQSPAEICRALAAPTLQVATAASHAPILLGNWPRTAGHTDLNGRMARGIARRLCEFPGLQAELPFRNAARRPGTLDELERVLCAIPRLDVAGWGIYFRIHLAESERLTEALPGMVPADFDDAFRRAFRVAAASMLTEDPEGAPYEWTHCLSLPMGLWHSARLHADPATALDMALTHVVGFRAANGSGAVAVPPPAALPGAPEAVMVDVIGEASTHHDAHLVKYVHACVDAATIDPAHGRLYADAATYLMRWWEANPPADDPLA